MVSGIIHSSHELARLRALFFDNSLANIHGQHFIRKVRQNGTVRIAEGSSYVNLDRIGQYVDLCVDAHQQVFVIRHRQQLLKQVPIKGLQNALLPFEQLAPLMCQQALSEQRRLRQWAACSIENIAQ